MPLTEEQLTPRGYVESPDFEGRLSDLLSSRDALQKVKEYELGKRIDRALLEYQEVRGGMEGQDWKLLRMFLLGNLS